MAKKDTQISVRLGERDVYHLDKIKEKYNHNTADAVSSALRAAYFIAEESNKQAIAEQNIANMLDIISDDLPDLYPEFTDLIGRYNDDVEFTDKDIDMMIEFVDESIETQMVILESGIPHDGTIDDIRDLRITSTYLKYKIR